MVHCRPGSRINSKYIIICLIRALDCSIELLSYSPNIIQHRASENGKQQEFNTGISFLEHLLSSIVCQPFSILIQIYCFSKSTNFNKGKSQSMTSNSDLLLCVMAVISSILRRRLNKCTSIRTNVKTQHPLVFALPYEITISWLIHNNKLSNYLPIINLICSTF
ncbi:hypothetical protein GJ496_009450 [Pomphorhynchus laevis]|nr:hypothetical protein GJ496_009450 [Pomphorhynchus laevis]